MEPLRFAFRFSGLRQLLPVALLAGSALCAAENQSRAVELVLNTKELAPTTTFELRFDEPMVAYAGSALLHPTRRSS